MTATLHCPDLSLAASASRLERLRRGLQDMGAGAAVLHEPDVIRWAIGCTSMHGWPGAVIVTAEEAIALLLAAGEQTSIATEQVVMPGISRARAVRHHAELAAAAAPWLGALASDGGSVGVDIHGAPAWVIAGLSGARAGTVDVAPLLLGLRRCKDADELAIIEHNVAIADLALKAAGEAIRPGVTELDVYQTIRHAVEMATGTSVDFGGDFKAGPGGGEGGGPPSTRLLVEGDSFVVDYFPHRGGYWADMCRTFPIGEPGSRLTEAIDVTRGALELADTIIRPGVRIADLDRALREHQTAFDQVAGDYFHLTGHGIGMRPHEAPWLVADSDEVFEVGDVIAVEPAAYADDLRGGVRIEDDYVVVEGGLRRLSRLER